MTIHIIASVFQYKSKLGIGRDNDLLVSIKPDLIRFKNLTLGKIVVMGMNTWNSLPEYNKPLKKRYNIILTNSRISDPLPSLNDMNYDNVYFTTYNWFLDFYNSFKPSIFVIGGSQIYKLFMDLHECKLFLTEIYGYNGFEPTTFMTKPGEKYKLVNFSKKIFDTTTNCYYRFLDYEYCADKISQEYKYLELCKHILTQGNFRPDRTGVGTVSVFGTQLRFNISEEIPLLTTKRVAWKHCIEELLWFLRGDTDAKILQKKNIKIWNGNTSRTFLDSRNLHHYDQGILGPGYGWCWRFFGATYDQSFADSTNINKSIGGFDQINYVINELKTNPFSRRILVSAWNPTQMNEVALMPCHYSFQFYVESNPLNSEEKYLSCHFIMRSNDLGCGLSFNLLSYTVLTYLIALKCNMKPKELVYTCSDTHIYQNHISALEEQMQRIPLVAPTLWINPDVKNKQFSEISILDFDIIGYFPEPSIKMEMAV